MSHQIFVSYAAVDQERIQPLVQAFEAQGWSVWWDKKIPPGRQFDEVIEEAIDAARCVVVVWSEKSVSSRWVRTEANEGERREILIPVLIDDVTIPLEFRRIEAAKLVDWDGVSGHPELDGLLEAAARLVKPPPSVEPDRPAIEIAEAERAAPKKAISPQPSASPALKEWHAELIKTGPRERVLSVQLSEATHVIEYRNSHLPWEEVVILNGNRLHQSKALVTLKTKFHFTFEVDDGAAKYPAVIMFKWSAKSWAGTIAEFQLSLAGRVLWKEDS